MGWLNILAILLFAGLILFVLALTLSFLLPDVEAIEYERVIRSANSFFFDSVIDRLNITDEEIYLTDISFNSCGAIGTSGNKLFCNNNITSNETCCNPFNQVLNTTSNVQFDKVTTDDYYTGYSSQAMIGLGDEGFHFQNQAGSEVLGIYENGEVYIQPPGTLPAGGDIVSKVTIDCSDGDSSICLRLIGSGAEGSNSRLDFGDPGNCYLQEFEDDRLQLLCNDQITLISDYMQFNTTGNIDINGIVYLKENTTVDEDLTVLGETNLTGDVQMFGDVFYDHDETQPARAFNTIYQNGNRTKQIYGTINVASLFAADGGVIDVYTGSSNPPTTHVVGHLGTNYYDGAAQVLGSLDNRTFEFFFIVQPNDYYIINSTTFGFSIITLVNNSWNEVEL